MKQFDFENNKIIEVKEIPACKWLKCYDKLIQFGFNDEQINKAIFDAELSINYLTDRVGYENINHFKYWKTPYDILKTNHTFKKEVYMGEYKKEVSVNGFEIRIPSQYQGLKHGDIIHNLFSDRYKWFSSFKKDKSYKESEISLDTIGRLDTSKLTEEHLKLTVAELLELTKKKDVIKKESSWSIYELHNNENSNDEIYLHTEFGSLYVPYEAILESNFSLIKSRMIKYAISYHDPKNLSGYALNHRGRTKEQYAIDKQSDYENMIKPLESNEAFKLQEYLEYGK